MTVTFTQHLACRVGFINVLMYLRAAYHGYNKVSQKRNSNNFDK